MEPEKGIIASSDLLLFGVIMGRAQMIWNKFYLHFL